jgi:hypothetical protein
MCLTCPHAKITVMVKPRDTTSLTLILLLWLSLVLIIGLVSSYPRNVSAQHQIDPETWIEMRKMLRNKGPVPAIEADVAALAGADAKHAGG